MGMSRCSASWILGTLCRLYWLLGDLLDELLGDPLCSEVVGILENLEIATPARGESGCSARRWRVEVFLVQMLL